MSLQHVAQHLASKGRGGDTTLVHMTKSEVAGLQALAKRNGTSLTINPRTGLPEAFSLKSLIPLAAGFMLGPAGFGIASSAMGAGLMVGGATALGTGSLKQGLVAGLGAYGGAGLGSGIGSVAGAEGTGVAGASGTGATSAAIPTSATPVVEAPLAALPDATAATSSFTPSTGSFSQNLPDFAGMPPQAGYAAPQGSPVNGYTMTNAEAVGPAQNPYADLQTTTPAVNSSSVNYQNGSDIGGMGSSPANMGKPPSAFDTISANAEANPKLLAYAAAPAISEELTPKPYLPPEIKGDSDMGQRYAYDSGYANEIPGRTGPASYSQIGGEDARKLYGFADGGEIQYPTGESVIRMADGGTASAGYGGNVGDYGPANANIAAYGLGTGIDYSGYNTAPNQGIAAIAPQGNPNQNIVELYKAADSKRMAEEARIAEEKRIADTVASISFDYAAGGGISTLGGYSDGGRLLKGPGDGMSDNIPAQIGRKQPARLADGEFVVPADVVSHLGNGSTDAGAKQLYKMMDKIRSARTGRKAQGKQVNPNKFMPA